MTIVTGEMPDTARAVIAAAATQQGAPLVDAAAGSRVFSTFDEGRATVTFDTPEGHYGPVPLALRGEHQIGNALVAVRLLEAARSFGLRIPPEAIERGLWQDPDPLDQQLLEAARSHGLNELSRRNNV